MILMLCFFLFFVFCFLFVLFCKLICVFLFHRHRPRSVPMLCFHIDHRHLISIYCMRMCCRLLCIWLALILKSRKYYVVFQRYVWKLTRSFTRTSTHAHKQTHTHKHTHTHTHTHTTPSTSASTSTSTNPFTKHHFKRGHTLLCFSF